MAIIKQFRDWNGIPVRIETNNETGKVEVYGVGQGSFGLVDSILFSSNGKGSDWNIPNLAVLTNSFNRANGRNSSQKEVERAFYLEGYKTFNNDRAAVLNNPANYDSFRESVILRQRFADQKTPLVTNPNTGLTINSDGEATSLANISPLGTTTFDGGTKDDSPPPPPGEAIDAPIETAEVAQAEQDSVPITNKTVKAKGDLNISVSSVGLLRYPLANLEAAETLGITYDYIKITAQEWQSSITGDSFNESASKRYSQSKGSLGTIILPMTNNMGSTNGVSWGENNANAVQLALLNSVGSFLTGVGNAKSVGEGIDAGKQALGTLTQGAKSVLNDFTGNKDAVAALLSGYVVGNTSLATRQSGIVINPNMELLFQGPKLRTFNFTFQFAPRFRAEADMVRQIVKAFKMFSAPEIDRTGAIFLRTPKTFQLDYIYNGDGSDVASGTTHPYLNKIKPCALTSVNVNYTPGGKYMTYADGGSMVQTTMTLSFNELEPIYQSDYTAENNHPAGY
jgi:hypothetical protein